MKTNCPKLSAIAPEKVLDIFFYYCHFINFLKFFFTFKSSITSLIFIFITYDYLAKKKDPIFKANFIYVYFIIL